MALGHRALASLLALAIAPLGCATAGGRVADPPAWSTPSFYELTRKAARTARGRAPVLLARVESARLPAPVLRWSPIAVWAAARPGIEALPFLPTPDRELRVPATLPGCAEAVVFADPTTGEEARGALAPGQDLLLAPLREERWAALPADPCALVLRYGEPEGRRGTWLQVVTQAGVVAEQLVVEPEPGYWLLVPFSAIGETAFYAVVLGVVLILAGASAQTGPG